MRRSTSDPRSAVYVIGVLIAIGLLSACQQPLSSLDRLAQAGAAVSEGESIQAAIDWAGEGGTIVVEAGHFTENLTLMDGQQLLGAGPDQTVLHGSIEFDGEYREGDPCLISGFHVTASGAVSPGSYGIRITRGPANIESNIVEGFSFSGIMLAPGFYGEVRGNIVRQNNHGIYFEETAYEPLIANNLILFNTKAGIRIYTDASPRIVHNTIVGNGFGDSAENQGAGVATYLEAHETMVNNIVVSNNGGINRLRGPNANDHHNLVWGNAVDYGTDAVPGEGDLSLDPRFTDPAQSDFRLRADSPAVDAGTADFTTDHDLDGTARPQGITVDLGAFERRVPASSVRLVISEVLANPIDEDRGEFVEVYNASETGFDLAGAFLTDGDARDVVTALDGGTTVVAAAAYAVIIDPEYDGGYDIPAGTTTVTLGNTTVGNGLSTNDTLTLYESDGVTVLATYAHPFDPGNGVSAERLDLEGPDTESNWRASPCTQSAGRPNCAPITLASGLIITEVMANPLDESTGEFVELFNGTEETVNAAGMALSDGDASDLIVGFDGGDTLIPATTYAVVLDPDWPDDQLVFVDPNAVLLTVTDSAIGNGLAVDDPVSLLSPTGEVLDSYTRTLSVGNGRSVEKVSLSLGDIAANWAQSSCEHGSSPGYLNCVSSASSGPKAPLVITEVMANPLDEDTGEFIELYNRGIDPVDAAGLILSDGDAIDVLGDYLGESTEIPAGDYALVVDAEYAGQYDLPAGMVLLTTQDSTLGSSLGLEDPIRLLAPNGVEIIDSFRYPFNPGNGVSAERIDVRGFDSPDNWTASTCESGSSPGANNCAASETGLPKQIRITEVMANQAGTEADGEGEFVELLNIGERSVDLAGMWLATGPEGATTRDELTPLTDEPTVLAPGAYAVILDPQYDDRYTLPPGTVVVTIDDNNFGSSGLATTHWATLYDVDGLTLLDRFRYPSDPGDGVSLYRVSLSVTDSAENWAATPCDATPGQGSCPDGDEVTTYVSFWVDSNASEAGIYWYQAIGWPQWYPGFCDLLIVCPTSPYGYTYRDNFPAPVAFEFHNPYAEHSVVFEERESPTHTCDPCGTPTVTVGPGETVLVQASGLGYYYAQTAGPRLNTLDWFEGDPDRYWALPPDGILAPFTVEVPQP